MTGHGGNVYGLIDETGMVLNEIIDFSASINPLGMPATVVRAIQEGIPELVHYPDPFAERVAQRMADWIDVDGSAVICGNGSTELIYLLARAMRPRRVLIPQPTFSEYERACRLQGAEIVSLPLSRDKSFAMEHDAFAAAMAGCEMAFLCNPNNPTGGLVERDSVLSLVAEATRCSCCLVVDEAFIDFVPEQTVVRQAAENGNLIVLRSLTKFYALSGLRIGFAVLSPRNAEKLRWHKEPWTVNTLAANAAAAAIEDREYQTKTLQVIAEERAFLIQGLRSAGIEHLSAAANYFLLRTGRAQEVLARSRRKGILLRDCSNFPGLDTTYLRVAIRSRRENDLLLKELSACAE